MSANADRMLEVAARTESRRSTFASRQEMYDHFRNRGAFNAWRDEYLSAYVEHGAIDLAAGGVELANPPRVEAELYRALIDWSEWESIEDSPVPVRVVFGEQGGRVRQGTDPADAIREMFTNVETQILPDCTHSGPMEHPDLFEASIRNFAAGLPLGDRI
jgi:pimeloyl-ACP methyl ester carboxylesterase